MPYYNTSNLTGNYIELITEVNRLSGGLLIAMLLFTIYIVLLIASKNQGFRVAMLGISFIMSIIFSIAWFMGWVAGYLVMFPIVALFVSIVVINLHD